MDSPVIYIASDPSDTSHRDNLARHLKAAFGAAGATIVHDGTTMAGATSEETRKAHLVAADVIVLLLSAHFFADDFCTSVALVWALARHRARDALVLAIRASSCLVDERVQGEMLLVPDGGRVEDPETWWSTCASTVRTRLSDAPLRRPSYEALEHKHVGERLSQLYWLGYLNGAVDTATLASLKACLRESGRLVAGDFLGDRFRLLKRRSSTSVQEEWEAYDRVDEASALVHVFREPLSGVLPEKRRRLELLVQLRHESIVRFRSGLVEEAKLGLCYCATELVTRRTLRERVEEGLFDAKEIDGLTGIADALAEAHAIGVSHGGVGPDSIVVDGVRGTGQFKLQWPIDLSDGTPNVRDGAPSWAADLIDFSRTLLFCLFGSALPFELSGEDLQRLIEARSCSADMKAMLSRCLVDGDLDGGTAVLATSLRSALRSAPETDGYEIDLQMVDIAGSSFWVGADEDDPRARPMEKPKQHVSVSDFQIGKYPVTQRLYKSVMRGNPSAHKNDWCPVTNVTFRNAIDFCNELSRRRGKPPAYRICADEILWLFDSEGYRLPLEAEWELAARGPHGWPFPWGYSDPGDRICWRGPGNPLGRKHPSSVRSHPEGATRAGVFHMIGNVWEFCWDRYYPYRFWRSADSPIVDPAGARNPFTPPSVSVRSDEPPQSYRVMRGGAWNMEDIVWMRATIRATDLEIPVEADPDVGFRIACGAKRAVTYVDDFAA